MAIVTKMRVKRNKDKGQLNAYASHIKQHGLRKQHHIVIRVNDYCIRLDLSEMTRFRAELHDAELSAEFYNKRSKPKLKTVCDRQPVTKT